jgi:hypothetical protein
MKYLVIACNIMKDELLRFEGTASPSSFGAVPPQDASENEGGH